MSLSSMLSIARTALGAHQQALDTTAHNIANASREGYTRQNLRLVAETPLSTPLGQIGRGVRADGIERLRDQFLDGTFRRESSTLSRFSTLADTLRQIESMFGEPTTDGLAATIDSFFSAFSDLANDPASLTARSALQQISEQLTQRLHQAAGSMDDISSQRLEVLRDSVGQANTLTTRIAELNRSIVAAESTGQPAPDLRDERDLLLDQLAELGPVRSFEREDGSIAVILGETSVVDGAQAETLTVKANANGGFVVGLEGSAVTVDLSGGKLGALVELTGSVIPNISQQLDQIAAALVSEINNLHRTGINLNGVSGVDFFDPAGVTAATISLSLEVASSISSIAAGTSGAPGDNSLALTIAGLRDQKLTILNDLTIGDAFRSLVTSVGLSIRDASQLASSQEVVVSNLKAQREADHGVSVDEELINLISNQQAFSAAARLVNVADEMVQEVLRMV